MQVDDRHINYAPLIYSRVKNLDDNTAVGRKAFYGQARHALNKQLRLIDGYENIEAQSQQLMLLENAISEVEAAFQSQETQPAASDVGVQKIHKGYFAQNTILSAAVNVLKTILQIVMIPVLARILGPNAYGVYSLALPTVIFFLLLADGGLGASMAREDEQNIVFWSTGFWLLLIVCTVMAFFVAGSGFVLAWILV